MTYSAGAASSTCMRSICSIWMGKTLRELELVERKSRLTKLIPEDTTRLLYVDHVEEKGVELFEKVCEVGLGGNCGETEGEFLRYPIKVSVDQDQEPELQSHRGARRVV